MDAKQDLRKLMWSIIDLMNKKVESKLLEASEFEAYCNGLEKLSLFYYNFPMATFAPKVIPESAK